MRIRGLRRRLTRIRDCPVQLWLLAPQPATGTEIRCFGRRKIEVPNGSVLSATWFEAWLYAHHPISVCYPRPVEHVYPEYCGLVLDGEVICGPAGPGPETGKPVYHLDEFYANPSGHRLSDG